VFTAPHKINEDPRPGKVRVIPTILETLSSMHVLSQAIWRISRN
jgi:hypothetical protein